LGATEDSQGVAAGDFDGDGDVDLAFADGADGVTVYENDAGTPAAVWTISSPSLAALAVAWSDVDSDGDLDLTVGYHSGSSSTPAIQIYQNQFGNTASPFALYTEDRRQLRVEDLSWGGSSGGSGLALVAVASDGADSLYDLTGTAASPILNVASIGPVGDSRAVAWGDLDGDGDLDVVIGTDDQGVTLYTIEALSVVGVESWGGSGGSGGFSGAVSVHSVDLGIGTATAISISWPASPRCSTAPPARRAW
jgi:hypothetical protein